MTTYTLASFSQTFPDIPYDENNLIKTSTDYINGTVKLSAVIAFQQKLNQQINDLKTYQSNLISSTPEYIDQTSTPVFLSSISTATTQASTLQTQLDIVTTNLQNSEAKMNGNMTAVIFYVYTTATIILGILCILLIAYLVYMYMDPSFEWASNSSMRGGKRSPL
jgi:hypothetical protein